MDIGVPKEIKDREYRVGITPAGVQALVGTGHRVRVEEGAGVGSGFGDDEYESAGADVSSRAEVWDSDLVVKIKEPLEEEYGLLRDQIVFTYFHLAGVPEALTDILLDRGTTAVAYETVRDQAGRLPLLAPMSGVAGIMSITIGTYYLAKFNGGKGTLPGRVLGSRHGKVVVIGDGVVGCHAARAAAGVGAEVVLFGLDPEREEQLIRDTSPEVKFVLSEPEAIGNHVRDADLVVGAVLVAGAKAPCVVTEAMVREMESGSVIVDVSIDQGGCVETSRPTSHSDPVFVKHDVTHYCVTNMPGAYARTSTVALTSATLPYVQALADRGSAALREDPGFAEGVNVFGGHITCRPVADALDRTESWAAFGDL